jgi:dihydroflavonol-4-reductase
MRIMIVGGTGFLGYHALKVALARGHQVDALAIDDVVLGDWYPKEVRVDFGDVFELGEDELKRRFQGYEGIVYAVGPDDRITPKAPAYDFFYPRLVVACEKVIRAARKAGLKRCVILNSYFAYFDRTRPHLELGKRHPYIRCRVEQAQRTIAAGVPSMAVMVLELPYIFGSMPNRTPLWKEVFLDRFVKSRTVFFPAGGTAMIAAQHVGEAIIGALERGSHGQRYAIGDENHTFKEMLETMFGFLQEKKTVIEIPRFAAEAAGRMINRSWIKKAWKEGLMPAILCVI